MKSKYVVIAGLFTSVVTSCGQISERMNAAKVDYQVLEKPDEVKKLYNQWIDKLGDHKAATDEVRTYVSRPSSEGLIQKKGADDELTMTVSYQSTTNKNQMYVIDYFSTLSGWQAGSSRDIQVMGSDAENYNIKHDLFDFSKITPELVNKVLADAKAVKDPNKYRYQYIQSLTINEQGFDITIHGRLATNDQEKSEYYKADLAGNKKE